MGVPHLDGESRHADEWEERVWLRFCSCENDTQKKALVFSVKNGLTGRAWEGVSVNAV